jgi:probable HAF family extracellular repeat protein
VITDLGTLGGGESTAWAINAGGQILGSSKTVKGEWHTVLWENGRIRDLGPLGAIAINDRGQIVADARNGALLWEDGKVTRLGTLGGATTVPVAINNQGQVVGWSDTKSRGEHAFLWQDEKMRDLGGLGGDWAHTEASDINERGQVVGTLWNRATSAQHTFLWQNGKMRDIGDFQIDSRLSEMINDRGQIIAGRKDQPDVVWQDGKVTPLTLGGRLSAARAINNRGQVAGIAQTRQGGGHWHVFLWQNGKIRDLGTLGGELTSDPTAINERGQIIGQRGATDNEHAFVWQDGKVTDLGTLRRHDRSSEARAINDQGQIVGISALCDPASGPTNRDCHPRAVLWTPKQP